MVVYGIPNCDSVKKARAGLAAAGRSFRFHDFRVDGLPADRLDAWIAAAGWERVLNRKGTTWRRLCDAQRDAVVDAASARAAVLAQPSLVKRPVIEWDDGRITIGLEAALALLPTT